MKILMINKFLYPNGGSETYIFKLGDYLKQQGHEVEYFGMDDSRNIVGNTQSSYTSNMDFHSSSLTNKALNAFKTIYSRDARKKIRIVLDAFQPDVCHLNNFNYQLTPSIILEIRKWEKETSKKCRIIYTAHDYQLVCPNHMCRNIIVNENCEKCLNGNFINCIKHKCIHKSLMKSIIGFMEASYWKYVKVYKEIDTIICCSHFMKSKLDTNPILRDKTIVLHNFIDKVETKEIQKKDYILYFGRYSKEKGIDTLISVCKELPNIQFVFAGNGPLETEINRVSNIRNIGFKSRDDLKVLIQQAQFTICPSEVYENCPFSVLESISYCTPVLGANVGGIPELIKENETGILFESGNKHDLKSKLISLYSDKKVLKEYSENCKNITFDSLEEYYCKFLSIIK